MQKSSDILKILTPKEQLTLKRRLRIAKYLLEGKDYNQIRMDLKVGFSTIARVNSWLHVSGKSVKKLLENKALLTQVLVTGGALSAYTLSSGADYDGTVALGMTAPFIAKHYIEGCHAERDFNLAKRGGENMMKKIIGTGLGTALLLTVAMPVFATDTTTGVGATVSACNQTAKDALKTVRDDFKAGKLTKDERNSKVKDAEKTRAACIKDAIAAHKADMKAKAEAKRAEAKAKMEAKKAEMKAKAEARKAAKNGGSTSSTTGQ